MAHYRRLDLIASKKAKTPKEERACVSFHPSLVQAKSIPHIVWCPVRDEGKTYYEGFKFGETNRSYLIEPCDVPIVLGD